MLVEPIILEGEFVRLEPLSETHFPELIEVGFVPELWKWTVNRVQTRDDLRHYLETALTDSRAGRTLPFATISKRNDRIVGSTRFGNIDVANRKTEIGWTWISPPWQRTAINTEAKRLMLTHAFETWACIRVELKTDVNNEKSLNAMKRIGCREEGTLRNHMITESGRFRDSVYFSIIDSEWPAVEANLRARLSDFR